MNNRDKIYNYIITAFGLGTAPVAPGTFGALGGMLIFLLIMIGFPTEYHQFLIGLALIITFVVGYLLCPWAEAYYGKKDPGPFVLDEVVGYLVTVLLFRGPDLFATAIWAFFITRFFDIIKPPPARQLEELPKGWGIMLDDILASLYAAAVLHIIAWFFPSWFGFRSLFIITNV